MAQMGGATWSHIQIAADADALHATRVDVAMADLVIACDTVVGANKATLSTMLPGRTFVVLNSHVTPTAAFVRNPDWQAPTDEAVAAISRGAGTGQLGILDAERLATQLLGQSIYSNLMLPGYAWQKGRVPLSREALTRAIELNGVQIDSNKAAFKWGRHCAHDLDKVPGRSANAQVIQFAKKPSISETIGKRAEFLASYQNRAYAARYEAFIEKVQEAESRLASHRLTETVARHLFKLMAYKDEYEVARLHTDAAFTNKVQAMFEGDYKLVHHLAPPLFAKRDSKGQHVKRPFGAWVRVAFRGLAALRGLRGTGLDPFGYTAERRTERALVGEYRACMQEVLETLSKDNLALALEIAALPEGIRGYGHVKARNIDAVRVRWAALMDTWRKTGPAAHEQAPIQRRQKAI
jgi:indolepyruvate ferredoxin oxidoreductase